MVLGRVSGHWCWRARLGVNDVQILWLGMAHFPCLKSQLIIVIYIYSGSKFAYRPVRSVYLNPFSRNDVILIKVCRRVSQLMKLFTGKAFERIYYKIPYRQLLQCSQYWYYS